MAVEEVLQHGFIAPQIDPDSAEWWQGVAEHRLLLPTCGSCGRAWFPPAPTCPYCGSADQSLRESAGLGRIYSWIVVHRALSPAFAEDVPYTIVIVDLDEGARMPGRLFGVARDRIAADLPVRARFYEVSGQTLVGFEPADRP